MCELHHSRLLTNPANEIRSSPPFHSHDQDGDERREREEEKNTNHPRRLFLECELEVEFLAEGIKRGTSWKTIDSRNNRVLVSVELFCLQQRWQEKGC